MNQIVIDIESYFNRAEDYDLGSMSVTEYIRDPRFQMHGFGLQMVGSDKKTWYSSPDILKTIDWSMTALAAHNIKFDGAILAWKYDIHPALYIDTKGLARAVIGPYISGYSLDEVGQYLKLKLKGDALERFDGVRVLTHEMEQDLAEYCLNDVSICNGILAHLWPKFPESQRGSLDWTIRTFIEPKLTLDVNILARMVDNEKRRREDAIQKSGVSKSVLSSNQQFAALLESQGIRVPKKRSQRTGKEIPSLGLSDGAFLALEKQVPVLFQARKAAKSTIIETRGENLINVGKTGPWPFDVQFSGAVQTHRYGGGNGAGGNPQNFPRGCDIKSAVVSGEVNTRLAVGDFAAIELRINAWISKEQWLMEMIRNNQDIYCGFGSKFFKRTITKEDKAERQFAKICELGLGYNMGVDRFINTVLIQTGEMISEEKAREAVYLYRSTHKNIVNLWRSAENLIPQMIDGKKNKVFFAPFLSIEKNAIVLPSGLKIMYPNLRRYQDEWVYDRFYKKHEPSPEKIYGGKLVENICQALAGEICKEAITSAISDGLEVVAQIHDEIICIDRKGNDAAILRNAMQTSPSWWPEIVLKAEIGEGLNWQSAKV